MIVKIDKSFVKDTDKIVDKKMLNSIAANQTAEFVRFLHRNKIYDSFPD